MGAITHLPYGTRLTRAEWEASNVHVDSQSNTVTLSRSATLVVASSDSSAKAKAGADYICDGTADEVELQAALDALPSGSGRVKCIGKNFYFADTVTIGVGSADYTKQALIFEEGSRIRPTADVDLFHLTNNAILANAWVYTYGFSYSKNAITIQGRQNSLQHVSFKGTEGVGTGTALLLDDTGTAHYVLYNKFDDIRIDGYEYGVRVKQTAAKPVFINRFTRLDGNHVVHFIYESTNPTVPGSTMLHMNHYDFTYQAFGTGSDIDCLYIAGLYSRYYGSTADFAGATIVTCSATAKYNLIDLRGTESDSEVSDLGDLNRFRFADGQIMQSVFYLNASSFYFQTNSPLLAARNFDTAYLRFGARDTGVATVEVARVQGAADPYFQATLPMVLKPVVTASLPATPVEGMIAYDNTLNKLVVYNGAAWETITSA